MMGNALAANNWVSPSNRAVNKTYQGRLIWARISPAVCGCVVWGVGFGDANIGGSVKDNVTAVVLAGEASTAGLVTTQGSVA